MLMHAHKPCCNKQPEMHSDNCAVNMQDVLFSQCLNLACGQFMSIYKNKKDSEKPKDVYATCRDCCHARLLEMELCDQKAVISAHGQFFCCILFLLYHLFCKCLATTHSGSTGKLHPGNTGWMMGPHEYKHLL